MSKQNFFSNLELIPKHKKKSKSNNFSSIDLIDITPPQLISTSEINNSTSISEFNSEFIAPPILLPAIEFNSSTFPTDSNGNSRILEEILSSESNENKLKIDENNSGVTIYNNSIQIQTHQLIHIQRFPRNVYRIFDRNLTQRDLDNFSNEIQRGLRKYSR